MTIIRIEKQKDFTVIDNYAAKDWRLSLGARGLHNYLIVQFDGWEISLQELINKSKKASKENEKPKDGKHLIRKYLKELESLGYIIRKKAKDEKGRYRGWESIVFERPTSDLPTSENLSPRSEILTSVELPLINTINKQTINTNVFIECRFEEFWAVYPRNERKKQAKEIWKRQKLDRIADKIINDVKVRTAKHQQWRDGFVPHAPTYLNGERWNDEIKEDSYVSRSSQRTLESIPQQAKRERAAIRAAEAAAAGKQSRTFNADT